MSFSILRDRVVMLRLRGLANIAVSLSVAGCARSSVMVPPTVGAYLRFDTTYSQDARFGLDGAAQAAGFPTLRTAILPADAREIRLSLVASGLVWSPDLVLRLIETPDQVIGELYFYWLRLRDSKGRDLQPYWVKYRESGCGAIRQSAKWGVCRVQTRQGVSWRAVADSLAALGVWKLLPDSAAKRRGMEVTDQEAVAIETLVSSSYRQFWYYDLGQLDGEDIPRVRAAANLVKDLLAQ
jgi:hypothetical protein